MNRKNINNLNTSFKLLINTRNSRGDKCNTPLITLNSSGNLKFFKLYFKFFIIDNNWYIHTTKNNYIS